VTKMTDCKVSKDSNEIAAPIFSLKKFSPEDFVRDFVDERNPCIISDLVTEWPAFQNWSLDYFSKHWGHIMVPLSPLVQGQSKPPWPKKSEQKTFVVFEGCQSDRGRHNVLCTTSTDKSFP